MKIHPKVSIVIPVYNGSNFLKDAIKSALAQIYKNIEILVINDGSRDNGKTAKIARSFGKKIRYFEKENGGVASALNLGIKKMTGEYFSWLSHDDLYYPNKIAYQLRWIKKLPKKTVLYGNFELVDKNGRCFKMFKFKPPPSDFIYSLIDGKFIHGCTIFVAKSAFKQVDLFNEKLKNAQDYEMWFRLMKKGYHFKHLPAILVKSRLHSQQGLNLRHEQQIADEEYLYHWVLRNFSIQEIFSYVDDKAFGYLLLWQKFKKTSLPKVAKFSRLLAIIHLGRRNFYRNIQLLIDTFKKDW